LSRQRRASFTQLRASYIDDEGHPSRALEITVADGEGLLSTGRRFGVSALVAIASSFSFWLSAYVSAIDYCRIGSNAQEFR